MSKPTSKTTNPYIRTPVYSRSTTICQAESKVVREVVLLLFTGSFSHGKRHIRDSCKQAPVKEHSFLQAPVRERERERAFLFIEKLGQRVVFNQP
jgi:hypothetical protein